MIYARYIKNILHSFPIILVIDDLTYDACLVPQTTSFFLPLGSGRLRRYLLAHSLTQSQVQGRWQPGKNNISGHREKNVPYLFLLTKKRKQEKGMSAMSSSSFLIRCFSYVPSNALFFFHRFSLTANEATKKKNNNSCAKSLRDEKTLVGDSSEAIGIRPTKLLSYLSRCGKSKRIFALELPFGW